MYNLKTDEAIEDMISSIMDDVYTSARIAEEYDIPIGTVQNVCQEGRIKFFRHIGSKTYLFHRIHVENYWGKKEKESN